MRRQQIIAENNQYKRIIAPRNWKPSDEQVDIIQVFNSHRDVNKRYIVLISNDITTYTLVTQFYHTINERIGGVDVQTNLPTGNTSFTFTAGSTHRWIIASRLGVNSISLGYLGAIWLHSCRRQFGIGFAVFNTYARILTCQDFNEITQFTSNQECSNLDGELNIPKNPLLTQIGDRIFRNTKVRGRLIIPENITRLGDSAIGQTFQSCLFDGELYLHDKLTHITFGSFQNCNSINKIIWKAPLQESIVTFETLGPMLGVTEVELLADKRGIAWSWSINISGLTNLNATALTNIFNSLLDLNTIGLPARTITIGTTNLNKLSQAEKDIALNKGYTLA